MEKEMLVNTDILIKTKNNCFNPST